MNKAINSLLFTALVPASVVAEKIKFCNYVNEGYMEAPKIITKTHCSEKRNETIKYRTLAFIIEKEGKFHKDSPIDSLNGGHIKYIEHTLKNGKTIVAKFTNADETNSFRTMGRVPTDVLCIKYIDTDGKMILHLDDKHLNGIVSFGEQIKKDGSILNMAEEVKNGKMTQRKLNRTYNAFVQKLLDLYKLY